MERIFDTGNHKIKESHAHANGNGFIQTNILSGA